MEREAEEHENLFVDVDLEDVDVRVELSSNRSQSSLGNRSKRVVKTVKITRLGEQITTLRFTDAKADKERRIKQFKTADMRLIVPQQTESPVECSLVKSYPDPAPLYGKRLSSAERNRVDGLPVPRQPQYTAVNVEQPKKNWMLLKKLRKLRDSMKL